MTRCRDVAASLLMLLLGGCDRDDLDYAVGTIERYRIDVVADSGEPVIELNVLEGDRVHPGMPLLAQDPGKLKIALDQAQVLHDACPRNVLHIRQNHLPCPPVNKKRLAVYLPPFFWIFAHESLSETVRLKTGLPSADSGSTQK